MHSETGKNHRRITPQHVGGVLLYGAAVAVLSYVALSILGLASIATAVAHGTVWVLAAVAVIALAYAMTSRWRRAQARAAGRQRNAEARGSLLSRSPHTAPEHVADEHVVLPRDDPREPAESERD